MENLGINIFESDAFCSDIVSLFFNHIWECDECLFKVFGYLIYFVLAVAVIFFVISCFYDFVSKFFSKLFDRFRYKKCYYDLMNDFSSLELKYSDLKSDYEQLEQDYFHTCN